jgi:hypothetical protein
MPSELLPPVEMIEMLCIVQPDGKLDACRADAEGAEKTSLDWAFAYVSSLRLAAKARDGSATVGRTFMLHWNLRRP